MEGIPSCWILCGNIIHRHYKINYYAIESLQPFNRVKLSIICLLFKYDNLFLISIISLATLIFLLLSLLRVVQGPRTFSTPLSSAQLVAVQKT
jgi:hypothetical protein